MTDPTLADQAAADVTAYLDLRDTNAATARGRGASVPWLASDGIDAMPTAIEVTAPIGPAGVSTVMSRPGSGSLPLRASDLRALLADRQQAHQQFAQLADRAERAEGQRNCVNARWHDERRLAAETEAKRDRLRQQLADTRETYEDLLDAISQLANWRAVTKHLTTEQRELWADAVDALNARLNPGSRFSRAARWWRDTDDQPDAPTTSGPVDTDTTCTTSTATYRWDETVTRHQGTVHIPITLPDGTPSDVRMDADAALILADMTRDAAAQPAQDGPQRRVDAESDPATATETPPTAAWGVDRQWTYRSTPTPDNPTGAITQGMTMPEADVRKHVTDLNARGHGGWTYSVVYRDLGPWTEAAATETSSDETEH